MTNNECVICGSDFKTNSDPNHQQTKCGICFRMQTGACRILGDMHDPAQFARHMCRVCRVQTKSTNSADQDTSPCSAKIRNKWSGIRQRHLGISNQPQDVISKNDLCRKLGGGVALCIYCDHYMASGLDRIDSMLGYTDANTVPCCTLCNFAKANFNQDIFLQKSCMICKRWSQELL